ncbi:MAG: peptidase M16 [Nitrospiraceae bacterium]|nr:peptidase M16 [Nitrospiraceae bacterium]
MQRTGQQQDAQYHRVTLDNGVRVVSEYIPSLRSVSLGIWIDVGSRDELRGEEGISHFIEHMFFKGTARRSADTISREIDQMGGELNAFTSRETTAFYLNVLDNDLIKAILLLIDLFQHSTFAARELEKEKQVILEEMRMIQDDPEDYVHDLHASNVLKRHPLGRPIIGSENAIKQLQRSDLLNYRMRHYHPEKIVISVAGKFDQRILINTLSKTFGRLQASASPSNGRSRPTITPGVVVRKKRLAQTHLCLGVKGLPRDHQNRYALGLLNSMLGGSVSSRLFREIREKRGLVYSIYSCLSTFEDVGMLTIYAATQSTEVPRVLKLIMKELQKFHAGILETNELRRAKCHIKSTIILGLESTSSRMTKLAKDEMYSRRYIPLQEIMAAIDRVKASEIKRLSHELIDKQFQTVTALGPLSRHTLQEIL